MRRTALTLAGLFVALVAQSSWIPQKTLALAQEWIVPKPIAGGDFIPELGRHRAGIIHQFFPIAVSLGGDGEWAEPNEITDFNGFVGVADVQGTGTATNPDGSTESLKFDTDMRFMSGVYVGEDNAVHKGVFGFV